MVSTHMYGVAKEIDRKMFNFRVNLGIWLQIDHLVKTSPVLMASTHISGDSNEIDGKTLIFQSKPRAYDWSNPSSWKNKPCPDELQHTRLALLSRQMGKTFTFQSKPRHVTPEIDCLEKNKPCSEGFSTHLWDVSKEIDGKKLIFQVNLAMWLLKSIVSCKTNPVVTVSTHNSGDSKEMDGKTFTYSSKPSHVTPQIDHLGKTRPVLRVFNTHLWCYQGDRWENIHF